MLQTLELHVFKGQHFQIEEAITPNGRVSCPKERFVVNQTLVFQIEFNDKSLALNKVQKHYH